MLSDFFFYNRHDNNRLFLTRALLHIEYLKSTVEAIKQFFDDVFAVGRPYIPSNKASPLSSSVTSVETTAAEKGEN